MSAGKPTILPANVGQRIFDSLLATRKILGWHGGIDVHFNAHRGDLKEIDSALTERWINGIELPTHDQLKVLAVLGNVTPEYLLYGHNLQKVNEEESMVAEDPIPVNAGHKFELMDRVNTLNIMFDQLIDQHPAAAALRKEITKISNLLGELYQKAAAQHINHVE